MIEPPRLGRHFRQTENECTTKICRTEKARQAPNPHGTDPVISLWLDGDLELQLEYWRSIQPKLPSRSRAIRVLLSRALAAEEEREDGSSDQKTEAQSSRA